MNTLKNIVLVFIPSVLFIIINNIIFSDDLSKRILNAFAIILLLILVIVFSHIEKKKNEKKELLINNQYAICRKILTSIIEIEKYKRNLLKMDPLPDYKHEVLLYNPHNYIEQICSNIRQLISDITKIDLSATSISFIYQYPTCNSKWQWITRKNSTINLELHDFVTTKNSYFNFIIRNNYTKHFEHDKENLVKSGDYWLSDHDNSFHILGSIASYKMSFIKNETTFCVGYLIISTYGRTFVEDKTNQVEISNFENLLTNTIIPSYRYIIETELGFMYERHNIREISNYQLS